MGRAMRGYGGRVLFVDVTTGASHIEAVPEDLARSLLGGNGFAARLLLDPLPAGVDAYDPPNPGIFPVGPVTATTAPRTTPSPLAPNSPPTPPFFHPPFPAP